MDWWITNQEDLNQLRRTINSSGALTPDIHAPVLDRIGGDLSARAKKLVAQQQEQLVDVCMSWGDQSKTSLTDPEHRREVVSWRLAERLHELGYQWPLGR